ncbi:MAG: hypothetical protein ACRELZ_24150 [Candidatus Rokuibacteriota bacterium]
MLVVALAFALVVPVLFIRQAPTADDVKIALVTPLSGRWARHGQLEKMGADMAIEEINSQGGIKALGGAKIVLREADAGDERRLTILLVEQRVVEALELCDRGYVLETGRVVLARERAALLADARVQRAYLGA